MSFTVFSPEEQAKGIFDGGRILERKPIGFPQDRGMQRPFSTLFYWAHAWSDQGGLIDEHPHQGFEIMSFVLTGDIEHYDSQLQGWKKLNAGDVQIIRAGRGITHAEKLNPGSSIFQIWFDPNLRESLSRPASYNDYRSEEFPVKEDKESRTRILVGSGVIDLASKVDYIQEVTFYVPEKKFAIQEEAFYSFFILEGELHLNGREMKKGFFAVVREEKEMNFTEIKANTKIFIIKTPVVPGFQTYAMAAGLSDQ